MEFESYPYAKKRRTRRFLDINHGSERGVKKCGPNSFQEALAEKILLRRMFSGQRIIQNCDIPSTRATFLVVSSPDGTKLASTNGNHNVYVVSATTRKIVKTLTGHERTPWTVAFHPSNSNILASGCLNGQVRVWNLEDDTCDVWESPGKTVIASLTFHPHLNLLVIATFRDLYFLDWNTCAVVWHTSTKDEKEKIRYVKFDTSGNKIITAIASNSDMASRSDGVTFREVNQFTQEKEMFLNFQRIRKFLNTEIMRMRTIETDANINVTRPKKGYSLPRLCTTHYSAVQDILNVDSFCPTKFSKKIMTLLKSDKAWNHPLRGSCCVCRYTWLYEAVFKVRLRREVKHVCHECGKGSADSKHAWNFQNSRRHELRLENQDDKNGLTENVLEHCFEHYARTIIAPFFAQSIPGSVSKKCLVITSQQYEDICNCCTKTQNSYSPGTALRSDCFINLCDKFPSRICDGFSGFLASFMNIYKLLPGLQRFSKEKDAEKLSVIMTEWEYLYCKMYLMANVIGGDDQFFLGKNAHWFQTKSNPPADITFPTMIPCINDLLGENEDQPNCSRKAECSSCQDRLNGVGTSLTTESLKILQRELDEMAEAITHRYNAYVQRVRIRDLFTHQCEPNPSIVAACIIRDVEISKRFVLTSISTSVRELKILLKSYYVTSPMTDGLFRESFSRMFIFITRRVASFFSKMLKFIVSHDCDTSRYSNVPGVHAGSFRYGTMYDHPRAYAVLNQRNQSVFDEENETVPHDFSDDGFDRISGGGAHGSQMYDSDEIDARVKQVVRNGVVCSDAHLREHFRSVDGISLDTTSENWRVIRGSFVTNNDVLLHGMFDYIHNRDDPEFEAGLRPNYGCSPLHRLQVWDSSRLEQLNISLRSSNVVVPECKVHNDATVAISHDDRCVATLLSSNQFCQLDWIGIFSLEWKSLGQILYAVALDQMAVCLSFSPTSEYLSVGYSYSYTQGIKMADVIAVKREAEQWKNLTQLNRSCPVITSIIDAKSSNRNLGPTTVNCIKWLPEAGQGLILGTSVGEIKFIC